MCILIAKEKGIANPSIDNLYNSFIYNSDGAGVSWTKGDGKIHYKKGLMKWEDFKNFHISAPYSKKPEDYAIMFHFRIATTGTINPANTHPFVVSNSIRDLQSIEGTTSKPIAGHNGIIQITLDKKDSHHDLSDTMSFIRRYLSSDVVIKNIHLTQVKDLLEKYIGASKMVIMKNDGTLTYLNKGMGIVDEGIWYSNHSYKSYTSKYNTYGSSYTPTNDWKKWYERYDIAYDDEDGYPTNTKSTKSATRDYNKEIWDSYNNFHSKENSKSIKLNDKQLISKDGGNSWEEGNYSSLEIKQCKYCDAKDYKEDMIRVKNIGWLCDECWADYLLDMYSYQDAESIYRVSWEEKGKDKNLTDLYYKTIHSEPVDKHL